jgi:hypothetical protein
MAPATLRQAKGGRYDGHVESDAEVGRILHGVPPGLNPNIPRP